MSENNDEIKGNNDENECEMKQELIKIGNKNIKHIEYETLSIDEEKVEGNSVKHSWSNCDGSTFNVRCGPDYGRNKLKDNSLDALYTVFAFDCYCTDKKILHICDYMDISKDIDRVNKKYGLNYHSKYCPLPPVIILVFHIPGLYLYIYVYIVFFYYGL